MKDDAFFSLARAFTHANVFFEDFMREDEPKEFTFTSFFLLPVGIYMLFWYSTLYNVCERLYTTGSLPEPIQTDFLSIKAKWEKCRHMAFHVKPEYFSEENFSMFKSSSETYKIVTRIHFSLAQIIVPALAEERNPFR
jgi:hypothetical protein